VAHSAIFLAAIRETVQVPVAPPFSVGVRMYQVPSPVTGDFFLSQKVF